jgi:hypothetical protein
MPTAKRSVGRGAVATAAHMRASQPPLPSLYLTIGYHDTCTQEQGFFRTYTFLS